MRGDIIFVRSDADATRRYRSLGTRAPVLSSGPTPPARSSISAAAGPKPSPGMDLARRTGRPRRPTGPTTAPQPFGAGWPAGTHSTCRAARQGRRSRRRCRTRTPGLGVTLPGAVLSDLVELTVANETRRTGRGWPKTGSRGADGGNVIVLGWLVKFSSRDQVSPDRNRSLRAHLGPDFAGQRAKCCGFDSRQLHKRKLVTAKSLGQLSFHQHLINIRINKSTDLAVAKSHQRHSRSDAPPFELRSSACESAHATT